MTSITPALCRAARSFLGWHQTDLAKTAQIGLTTLRNFEAGKSSLMANNLRAIETALEAAGIEFIPGDGAGVGLRLRQDSKQAPV